MAVFFLIQFFTFSICSFHCAAQSFSCFHTETMSIQYLYLLENVDFTLFFAIYPLIYSNFKPIFSVRLLLLFSFLLQRACINQLSLPVWSDLRVSALPVGLLHFHNTLQRMYAGNVELYISGMLLLRVI